MLNLIKGEARERAESRQNREKQHHHGRPGGVGEYACAPAEQQHDANERVADRDLTRAPISAGHVDEVGFATEPDACMPPIISCPRSWPAR